MHPYMIVAAIILVAVSVNIPLGYLRQPTVKFSFAWYFYIHISIPLLIYLRIKTDMNWKIIPFTIAGAIVGQIIGGRLRARSNEK